ncbi:MAG: hypothetical protein KY460_13150 [Actinobacteria bacterium]|nr:hypothetical protein [Actinomycetota bacterium]
MSSEIAVPWYVRWVIDVPVRHNPPDEVTFFTIDRLNEINIDSVYGVTLYADHAEGDGVVIAGYASAATVEDAYQSFRDAVRPAVSHREPFAVVEIGASRSRTPESAR